MKLKCNKVGDMHLTTGTGHIWIRFQIVVNYKKKQW